MNLIKIDTQEYPRSIWQLRREYPNVSFADVVSDEDLAPYGHANVYPTPQPLDWDQRAQRIEEAPPVFSANGTYCQAWVVRAATAAEMAEWDAANKSAPQWQPFAAALAISPAVNTLVATAASQAPVLHLMLGVGMGQAAQGDTSTFATAWSQALAAGLASTGLADEVAALAQDCNLPAEFVAALSP